MRQIIEVDMKDFDDALIQILFSSRNDEDIDRKIAEHATVVKHLVCHLAKRGRLTESSIRSLYADWADIVVEEFKDPRSNIGRKLH
jgi:hypothetical protein